MYSLIAENLDRIHNHNNYMHSLSIIYGNIIVYILYLHYIYVEDKLSPVGRLFGSNNNNNKIIGMIMITIKMIIIIIDDNNQRKNDNTNDCIFSIMLLYDYNYYLITIIIFIPIIIITYIIFIIIRQNFSHNHHNYSSCHHYSVNIEDKYDYENNNRKPRLQLQHNNLKFGMMSNSNLLKIQHASF